MNLLLLSELANDQVNLLKALLLIEEHVFGKKTSLTNQFERLVEHCQQAIEREQDPLIKVQCFLENMFVNLLFIEQVQQKPHGSECYQLAPALAQLTMAPALKIIVMQELAQRCGLSCDVVFIPKMLMMRVICDEDYAVIFEPITGEPIDWHTLDQRLTDLDGDPESISLDGESNTVLLRNYLLNLKNALINEQKFQQALRCVDLLLAIKPNDPIERRDRGFLFYQLDCFKVACDDYRYFVEQCPEDPAAQLLKIQLDNIQLDNTVLH
ncbi:MAG: tetratricopeptide repeat protein [Alteromonadaceae bacterium]|nr:tetratricopeptide repeat protein [Alteromonadaceae bacterium]